MAVHLADHGRRRAPNRGGAIEARCAIVVPHYRPSLTDDEWFSLGQLVEHLGTDIHLVRPVSIPFNLPYVVTPAVVVPDRYFDTARRGYSALFYSRGLYESFAAAGYTHVLIYQLDALVFAPRLAEFLDGEYDYIGAPHARSAPVPVGQGGFSLRRLDAFLEVLAGRARWVDPDAYWRDVGMAEDYFWSLAVKTAPLEAAIRFAWETEPRHWYERARRELPFGCHAWRRYDPEFWRGALAPHGIVLPAVA
jgi:hypothetical protein